MAPRISFSNHDHPYHIRLVRMNGIYHLWCSCCLEVGPGIELISHQGKDLHVFVWSKQYVCGPELIPLPTGRGSVKRPLDGQYYCTKLLWNDIDVTPHHHHEYSAKCRSFTANSGTKVAVLLKGRSSTASSGTQAEVLLGMNRWGSVPHPTLSLSLFSIWTDLKRSEKIPGAPTRRWR